MKNKKFSGEKSVYTVIIIVFCICAILMSVSTNKKLKDLSSAEAVVIHDVTLTSKEDKDKKTVYITPSGGRYHLDGCSYLGENKIAISKNEAKNSGYESCVNCQP